MPESDGHAANSAPDPASAPAGPFVGTSAGTPAAGAVVVIGAGPAGLMAAEALAAAGHAVDVYDAMPSAGRKFLLAGKGGLNLTHSEGFEPFVGRYRERAPQLRALLSRFDNAAHRDWAAALGVQTFVGSSGRVFPVDMKAAPLLRAWLHRLRGQGVRLHMRHRWRGWAADGQALRFESPTGTLEVQPAATVLALGGASWPRLGSDGAWWPWLQTRGVALAPLVPSNCGFHLAWSEHLRQRHAGAALKGVRLQVGQGPDAWQQLGECVITEHGLEGSLVYAASPLLREAIAREGHADFALDLLPARELAWVQRELAHPRGTRSLATHLKTRLSLAGAKAALLWEVAPKSALADPAALAALIKALPLRATAARPIDEVISSAGGVAFEALDERLMLRGLPGVFVAGEMLDWEAPTGGYLLAGCFASGLAAGQGAAAWLARQALPEPAGSARAA